MYADDVALVAQTDSFTQLEVIFNEDLTCLNRYFMNLYLTLNLNKSATIAFHLNTRKQGRN